MPSEEELKDMAQAGNDFVNAFEKLSGSLSESDKQAFNQLFRVRGAVTGRDTDAFNVSMDILGTDEIRQMRREVASAIAAEQYAKGAMMAMKIITMLGGMP